MTHNHICETAVTKECTCECKGVFHGIHKQVKMDLFIFTDKDKPYVFPEDRIEVQKQQEIEAKLPWYEQVKAHGWTLD